MRYVDYEELPEAAITKVFDALTDAFTASGADAATAMAAMCHKLAALVAEFTETEQEACILMAAFANDVLTRVPSYKKPRLDS